MAEKKTVTLEGDFLQLCSYIMGVVAKKTGYVGCEVGKYSNGKKILTIKLGILYVEYRFHRAYARHKDDEYLVEIEDNGDHVVLSFDDVDFIVKRRVDVDDVGDVLIIEIELNDSDKVGCI